uniref:DUF4780 domain-containing protein n=1 Tax=Macrostomum lignano TaxID=282301 RepID=A0A1I8HLU8_9PLAT
MARRRAWERTKSVSGRPSVAQQAVHVSTGSGQTPPERTLQGEQQDVLNRLGAVALGPDHVARQLKSPPAQDGGRALQLGPIVQGLGPDALVSSKGRTEQSLSAPSPAAALARQRPRLGVVEQDGFDHRLPQPSPLAVGQRFRLEDGSDRTKGRPGESPAPPEVFLHVGHQTAEVGEPLAACELGRLPVCAAARQVRWDVGRHSQHLCMLRLEDANTDALEDLLDRLDLVSANTQFRKPPARLVTFAGCKRRRRNARGRNATRRLAQLDHALVRTRERR